MNRKTLKYKYVTSVILYLKETWRNKLCAIALGLLGWVSAVLTGDGTGFIFMLLIAVPLFLAMENWMFTEGES